MVRETALRFKKGDLIAVAVVVLLAVLVLFLFLPRGETASLAEIYRDGTLIRTVSLDEAQTFTVEGRYHSTIRVENGAISFIESDCPGRDCVHSGAVSTSGRVLVCLPNGVEIRVISEESDVDLVLR